MMWASAFSLWKHAVRQPAVWSPLVWMGLLIGLLMGVISQMPHPVLVPVMHPGTAPPHWIVAPAARLRLLWVTAGVGVLVLGIGPFITAGTCGLLAQALRGLPMTWRDFWPQAVRLYGRAWGYSGFLLLMAGLWLLLSGVLSGFLQTGSWVVAILAGVAALPGILRMAGGLFVDRLSWFQSWDALFCRAHYGGLLGGIGLTGAVFLVVYGLLGEIPGVPGLVLSGALFGILSIAGPLWLLALYRAATA
ncbi:MAG: hypothetical protein C7B43_19435 [Sulfobacillus benefaciens]|uniref:DUF4013 domain-containing protein n=1 Tax=Sulfobacillus benefaciens TaxID=453960 RepID=A0A2T2WPY8_9FIRM|nr:MAG: hypothetical protein C7B43_19435 [Sulfobacillus benefaciens]